MRGLRHTLFSVALVSLLPAFSAEHAELQSNTDGSARDYVLDVSLSIKDLNSVEVGSFLKRLGSL